MRIGRSEGADSTSAGRAALVALARIAAVALATLPSLTAHAYRTSADTPDFDGVAARWASSTISIHAAIAPTAPVAGSDFEAAILGAARAWNSVPSSSVEIRFDGFRFDRAVPGDGINTIDWVTTGWAERGFPAGAGGTSDVQYARSSATARWEIVEVDIYLNAADFDIGSGGTAPDDRDLRAILTHEFGHLVGLLHNCEPGGADGAPDCADHPEMASATMYPFYDFGQREISDDDAAGVTFLYAADAPAGCEATGCPGGEACIDGACVALCGGAFLCGEAEACTDGLCVRPCDTESDCPMGQACVDGTCRSGGASLGDPCADDTACRGGLCRAGSCTTWCRSDLCPVGFSCDTATDECVPEAAGFGAMCDSADDCIGARCLAETTPEPICTRSCEDTAPCPAGYVCGDVMGTQVCRPPPPEGGCAVSSTGSRSAWLWLLAPAACLARRRRRTPRCR